MENIEYLATLSSKWPVGVDYWGNHGRKRACTISMIWIIHRTITVYIQQPYNAKPPSYLWCSPDTEKRVTWLDWCRCAIGNCPISSVARYLESARNWVISKYWFVFSLFLLLFTLNSKWDTAIPPAQAAPDTPIKCPLPMSALNNEAPILIKDLHSIQKRPQQYRRRHQCPPNR